MSIYQEDLDLVAGILDGKEAEFDRFFDTCYPRLFRFALRRLDGNRPAAEDAAQATLLRAIDALPSYRGEASLLTFVFTLCRRELAAQWRTAQIENRLTRIENQGEVRAALESLSLDDPHEPDRIAGNLERCEAVQVALDYLPEDYAVALEMKYLQDANVREIAVRLGRSTKATESLLTRAREMFRDAVLQLYGADAVDNLAG